MASLLSLLNPPASATFGNFVATSAQRAAAAAEARALWPTLSPALQTEYGSIDGFASYYSEDYNIWIRQSQSEGKLFLGGALFVLLFADGWVKLGALPLALWGISKSGAGGW